MSIRLIRACTDDAEKLWKMQIEAFRELYAKYQDTETSPGAETIDKTIARLEQPFTFYYFIVDQEQTVGAIRVIDHKDGGTKRISPLFIMPEYRNKGYAQKAMLLAEQIHGRSDWELDTVLQEKGNCHLYEKMGYRQTGKREEINDKLTLVFYKKE